MNLDRYINKSSNLYAENRLLKFAVVCIGIAVVISGFFSYIAMQYQKVVILPPVVLAALLAIHPAWTLSAYQG